MRGPEQGFTFIEAILVLAIFLIISSITAFSIKPQFESKESEQFLTEFQTDFLYGQQYAISHQTEVNFFIIPGQHFYYMRAGSSPTPIVKRYYSKRINVSQGSLPLPLKFTPSGFVNKFGTILIQCGRRHYRITVLIGKGRFYVVEE